MAARRGDSAAVKQPAARLVKQHMPGGEHSESLRQGPIAVPPDLHPRHLSQRLLECQQSLRSRETASASTTACQADSVATATGELRQLINARPRTRAQRVQKDQQRRPPAIQRNDAVARPVAQRTPSGSRRRWRKPQVPRSLRQPITPQPATRQTHGTKTGPPERTPVRIAWSEP